MRKEQKINLRIQFIVLATGILLMFLKFITWYITSSNAVLSDAAESVVNVLAGTFTLYSIYLTARPKDKNHPYGHGKIEFLSSLIEGSLLLSAGVVMVIKTIYNYIDPSDIAEADTGLWLVVIAGLVNGMMGFFLIARGKKTKSIAFISQGKHLLSDMITTIAVLLSLALIALFQISWIDNIISFVISLFLIYSGWRIVKKSSGGIMDEADPALINEVLEVINKEKKDDWIDLHNFRIIQYGPMMHIDCHLTIPYYYSLKQAHEVINEFEQKINAHFQNRVEIFVHMDPCEKLSCKVCRLENCDKRSFPTEKKIEWNLQTITENKKHYAHVR